MSDPQQNLHYQGPTYILTTGMMLSPGVNKGGHSMMTINIHLSANSKQQYIN